MELTPEVKATIDKKSLYELMKHWRFAPIGDPWLQGEVGQYWGQRIGQLRAENNDAYVQTSKAIGWDRP